MDFLFVQFHSTIKQVNILQKHYENLYFKYMNIIVYY